MGFGDGCIRLLMVCHVVQWERNSLCICNTTLLCLVVLDIVEGGLFARGEEGETCVGSCIGQRLQRGIGCLVGQIVCFLWLPMYWPYLNLRVYVICTLGCKLEKLDC